MSIFVAATGNLRLEVPGSKTGSMSVKDVIANGVIIGMSGVLLWHFLLIWRYERYLVGEPNIIIRSLETAGLVFIFVFGISKYITDLKRAIEKGNKNIGRRQ